METLASIETFIETNPFMHGTMFLLFITCSKFAFDHLRESFEEFFTNIIVHFVIIFSGAFIATKNVRISLILTVVFVLLFDGILNPDSKFYMGKKKQKVKESTELTEPIDYIMPRDMVQTQRQSNQFMNFPLLDSAMSGY